MVAPLIVGAARVVGAKAAQREAGSTGIKRANSRTRNSVANSRQASRARTPQATASATHLSSDTRRRDTTASQEEARNRISPLPSFGAEKGEASTAATLIKRVKAGQVSIMIFWSAIGFWIPQIAFWMLGLIGIGGESVPLFNYIFPGQVVYMLSYIVIVGVGICTMAYSAFMYAMRGVDCFSRYKGLIFILCLTGYLVIFINAFPWFIVWLTAVSYFQQDE